MLALDHVWKVQFFRMRISGRKLPRIEPGKVWIMPLSDTQYQIWPPMRRGSGRRGSGADDGEDAGDGEAAALQDDVLLDDTEDGDSQDEVDGADIAQHRDIINLLDQGLAAMQDHAKHASANGSASGRSDGEQEPPDLDKAPQDSDDSSSSSSDDSSSISGGAMPAGAATAEDASIRGSADVVFVLPDGCGVIKYYGKSSNFTAECKCANHQKCTKTRQSTSAANLSTVKTPSINMQAKGRPLGYLTAWLLDGKNHTSKSEHWARENEILATVFDERVSARNMLALHADGLQLLEKERPKREGEADEPAGLA